MMRDSVLCSCGRCRGRSECFGWASATLFLRSTSTCASASTCASTCASCVCVCVCAQIRVSTITLSNHSAFSQVIGWKTHHTAPFHLYFKCKNKIPFQLRLRGTTKSDRRARCARFSCSRDAPRQHTPHGVRASPLSRRAGIRAPTPEWHDLFRVARAALVRSHTRTALTVTVSATCA